MAASQRVRARARAGKGAKQAKIVITGPYGAGKTTLIKTMSEVAVLSTERQVTGSRATEQKTNTTVAMDFGRLTIDTELVLYLFGTPGQKRFDFMWDILSEGMIGFVVLVDAQRESSVEEAAEILQYFRDVAEVPFVVAVNKLESSAGGELEQVREWLRLPEDVRCIAVDARDKESVKDVLLELLYAVVDDIDESAPAAV